MLWKLCTWTVLQTKRVIAGNLRFCRGYVAVTWSRWEAESTWRVCYIIQSHAGEGAILWKSRGVWLHGYLPPVISHRCHVYVAAVCTCREKRQLLKAGAHMWVSEFSQAYFTGCVKFPDVCMKRLSLTGRGIWGWQLIGNRSHCYRLSLLRHCLVSAKCRKTSSEQV